MEDAPSRLRNWDVLSKGGIHAAQTLTMPSLRGVQTERVSARLETAREDAAIERASSRTIGSTAKIYGAAAETIRQIRDLAQAQPVALRLNDQRRVDDAHHRGQRSARIRERGVGGRSDIVQAVLPQHRTRRKTGPSRSRSGTPALATGRRPACFESCRRTRPGRPA